LSVLEAPLLHVVLVRPEIPPNTGSVARLCAANRLRLHLVGPLGFKIDDKHLKRAGLDYWPHVDVQVYPAWEEFIVRAPGGRRLYFSARARRSYLDVRYGEGGCLVFGGESNGLAPEILAENRADTFGIPMRSAHVRSLNLSNAVSIVVYEALRQLDAMTG
jgi:tRNA (cytidine/uridine-2'-O-)-methyltransferase